MVAALVAGPASRKTRAAPGLSPFNIKAAAMGVDDVAQTYIGIPAINMTSIDKNLWSLAQRVKSSGKKKVITPAIKIPTAKGLAISVNSSEKAYFKPRLNFWNSVSFFCCASAQLSDLQPHVLPGF